MKEYPVINSAIENEDIVIKKFYNIGIAVATDDGLIVPNIKDADKKSLYDLAKEIINLAGKARDRKLALSEMKPIILNVSENNLFVILSIDDTCPVRSTQVNCFQNIPKQ